MDKRQELIIRRMLQQGGLSKNQELTLRRAIAGEIDPSDAIDSANIQFLKPRKSFDELVAEKRKISPEEEIEFDRKTGIKDTKLRSALGAAENKEEEESILYKFGLTKSDFVRDKRGNLALTPDGATKFGVKTDRNIVIDEEGFSRYDLADLTAIAPEFSGAVAGAIAGQTLIPIPILGAMIGAGLGGAGGSLLEEGIEGLAGVSKQTAGEIAKDAAIEGGISALGEGVVSILGQGFNILRRGQKSGADDDTIRAVGMGREEFGITADPGRSGFNPILSRAFATGEKIFGGSPRTFKNNQAIQKVLTEFRDAAGEIDPNGLGAALFTAREGGKKFVNDSVVDAQKKVLSQFKSVADDLGRASKDGIENVNEDLYNAWKNAYKDFESLAGAQFSSIDEAVKSAAGDANIIPIKDIKTFAKTNQDRFRGSVLTDSTGTTVTALSSLNSLGRGNKASFAQLYNARKSLNDFIAMNPKDTTLQRYGGDLLKLIDNKLEYSNIEDIVANAGKTLDDAGRESILNAAEAIPKARQFYREGMTRWGEVSKTSNLNSIRRELRDLGRANPAGMMNRLVKNNDSETLKRAKNMLGKEWEPLRSRIAGEWIRDNIGRSINEINPNNFSATTFLTKVDNLGAAGDELFGEATYKSLKNLARQMQATNLKDTSEGVLSRINALIDADEPTIGLLKDLQKAQKEAYEFEKDRVLRKLDSGDLDEVAAANLITSPSTSPTTIRKLYKFFGDPAAHEKLRGVYMENLVGDFGEKFVSEPGKMTEFGTRLIREADSGRLKELFGEEMAGRMKRFGETLTFNAKTADGGGLVAAHVAMSPLQNLDKLAKFGLITRMFSTDLFYKNIDEQYRALTGRASIRDKANIFGRLLADAISKSVAQAGAQTFEESVSSAKETAENLIQSTIDENPQKPKAPVPMKTPVPTVLPALNVSPTPIPTPNQPQDILSQIRQRAVEKRNIRQRARENPAVAATLLGGLGSASLL
tara:strand:+ start:1523 stop:4480 length:2958 start_codon:yes stop_codon:yes gene_type:complete